MNKPGILIVEDEAIISADIANKLRRLGYEVAGSTRTGEEAVKLARQLRPSLVLMDIRLAGAMDGITAADEIRRECLLPVVFLSAHSDMATIQRAVKSEAFGYLLKPFEDRELHTQIEMALYKHAAERRLQESESRLREVLENSLDASYKRNLQTNAYDYLSPVFARIFGYSPVEMTTLSIETMNALIHPDDKAEVERVISGSLSGADGTAHHMEYRFKHKEGQYLWLHDQFIVMRDAGGQPLALIGSASEITERKQLDDAQLFLLKSSSTGSGEDFFKSLARYLAQSLNMDYVCIDRLEGKGLSARTVAIYFDGKFEDNTSYTLKDTPCGDVVGKTICCFDRDVRHLYPQDAVLQEMKAESYVGTTLWSFDGKPIGLIAIISRRPLTNPRPAESLLKMTGLRAAGELERQQAIDALMNNEKKLKKSHETLENRVKERTQELFLANTQLRQEIEDRLQTELALKESSDFIHKIFDASPLGIIAYEATGQCIMANKASESFIGASREEILRQNFNHLDSWKKSGLLTAARKVIQTNQPRENLELQVVTTFGRDITLNCSLIPFSTVNKPHLLLMGQDISRQKQADEALRQSQKLATIGLLVAGIAHEINNPNGFIIFNLPILRDYLQEMTSIIDDYMGNLPNRRLFGRNYDEFRKDLFKLLDNIEHGAHRINATVSGLINFSRNREKLELRRTALKPVIEHAVSICREEIRKNVKSLHLDIPEYLPPILADPEAVEQILVNLLINAGHAADKEDSWIRLCVRFDSGRPGRCIIEIDDNGCGMDEKTLNRIFDPFYTRKASVQGTGLGLYVSQNLAEGLGGKIEVESQPNQGSSFKLILNNYL